MKGFRRRTVPTTIGVLAVLALISSVRAADRVVDLTSAVVLHAGRPSGPARKAVPLLAEEIGKRSHVAWRIVDAWPGDETPVIVVGLVDDVRRLAGERGLAVPADDRKTGHEGYRIAVEPGRGMPIVWIAGDDDRGVLYGAGRLLRALDIRRERITLPAAFRVSTAPRSAVRGVQLGYRPKTNSYDAWTVADWDQYMRDMVVFGCNAVELIPPRSDDDADSPHFPLPALRMMTEMSRLADSYGLDVWAWYPAMDRDYANPATVAASLEEWRSVFKELPRLDAVFVPGGDPGHTPPAVLFNLLEKQTANLRSVHPKAAMWVSPQGFSHAWLDEFLGLLRQEPAWLAGVVYGPQVRIDLPAFRAAVPTRYPVRDYPDVTHSRHCQYPVPDWDVALALTEGREVSNPRPEAMAHIFRRSRPHTVGTIVYSEGCHDDVNKIVCLALGWDERTDVRDVLRDYGRHFVGAALGDRFADGLLALERNWEGAVAQNRGIDATLEAFRAMEHDASPAVKRNWRFQQALYRAYLDAYTRARLRAETERENEARAKLAEAETVGMRRALDEADAILARPAAGAEVVALRARLGELAEALFQSIGAQLSVRKYGAIAPERGATLDTADLPLTDAGWLKAQIAAIRGLGSESERSAALKALLHRTDAGLGGFYDDLGDPANQPHLVRGIGPGDDPAFYASSLVGFSFRGNGPDRAAPRAWWHHAESLYDAPLTMRYDGLDPNAQYRVRVVYARERRAVKIRLAADGLEVHGPIERPFEPLEFAIPARATADGTLSLAWTQGPGAGGTGRGCQVAEVWLIKTSTETR